MAQPQRPVTQGQAGPREKILRIGIILGGKIVEERLIRKRETVTVGQSAKNTFAIPVEELPRQWPLFELTKDGKYRLNFTEGMDARISDGGTVQALAQLKSSGAAQKSQAGYVMALSESARGKVMLGDTTVLFQFVMAPPLQPRPMLPQSVRGRLLDRIDPYMAVVLAFSVLLHGGAIAYIYSMDTPRKPLPEEIPDRFAKQIMQTPPEPKKVEAPPAETKTGGEEKKEEPKKAGGGDNNVKKPPKEPAGGGGGDEEARAKEEADARGVISLIGAQNTGGQGRFNDVTDGKNPGGDLQAGIDKARRDGQGVATSGRGGSGTRGSATGSVGSGTGPGVAGPKGTGGGSNVHVGEDKVGIVESKKPIVDDAGGLDAESVYRKIKSQYQGQIQKCYNDALKSNSGLKGRVDVTITIGAGGNVTAVDVSGFDPGVDACIQAAARRWRFDKPPGGSATFQFPFTFRPAN
jgi:TonB family protein